MSYAIEDFEKLLSEKNYSSFSRYEKNTLIAYLASNDNLVYTDVTEEFILNFYKEFKIKKLNETCENEIIKGFTSLNGHTYRTDRDDQINMMGQKYYLIDNPSVTTVLWKTEDLGYIEHTRDEWLSVYNEAFSHKQKQLFKYNDLKNAINKSLTIDEVELVSW